jgi:hypothetical protein
MESFPYYFSMQKILISASGLSSMIANYEEPAMPSNSTKKKPSTKKRTVQFHMIKGNFFRVIHADGAWGGFNPAGDSIHMTIFSERIPIPTQITHSIEQSNRLGKELRDERQARDGIVRELEVDIVLDLRAAEGMHKWLADKIERLKEIQKKRLAP